MRMMMIYRQSSILHSCSRLSAYTSSSSSSSFLSPIKPSSVQSLIWLKPSRRRIRAYATSSLASVEDVDVKRRNDNSTSFFADDSISWTSLGVSEQLSNALHSIGLQKPSLIQAACIPSIHSGNDVVVAAETGSGKTHGYLVPLINNLLKSDSSDDDSVSGTSDLNHGAPRFGKFSLVLCPNVMLCEQVTKMANSLVGDSGEALLRVAAVCGRQGWPVAPLDIIVSTPAALLNYLFAIDPDRRRRTDFVRGLKYVVFDETDMLLCGSFQNQVIRLIHMFRFEEKVLSRAKSAQISNSAELNAESLSLPEYDDEAEDEELKAAFDSKEDEGTEDEDEEEEDAEVGGADVEVAESSGILRVSKEIGAGSSRTRDWRRARKIYERSKQYIFVAATLPANGKQMAGGVLKRLFPDASWVSGNYLHCNNPRLEQRWIQVTVDTQVDELINAVKQGMQHDNGISRTMVFANTVEAVESVAKILLRVGVECFFYHSSCSLEVRTKNLTDFQEKGGVLVCTDAAARGLDIPNISHVIQAEFASSAVDFLHRIGRTARAGEAGLVTSLYTRSNRDLVDALRQAGKTGQPVEKAFSRKRGFRNKLKKQAGLRRLDDASSVQNNRAVLA
ncbi:DEAD-box ATP-dependent RNA helicase 22-like isoform X1 [Papaver somniferum]|uniref:DEAD-box ATP-dependent RNA helicase 22-like isoform X1 n=1 Tax=Papaver somniferum TaxID=3469 RepID=UPI000E6F9ABE|nr:DEAD-box ATP-dependent RNA helicase 22-like isoform X1 [Papaver somniferum]XP_026381773.1 DEAD-box ATP-dependent RNA helicase 22-like isoform X1 [Papaver somniferum]XP_026381774.1 DEAD-box ATP-dependent RNA helicase 22-like isoform X1 [Papaver somniferum]XP_026381775.1 DEAD-box ATP-dependent RNA helicase 22-like isoform X1 [Papaver somniferum]